MFIYLSDGALYKHLYEKCVTEMTGNSVNQVMKRVSLYSDLSPKAGRDPAAPHGLTEVRIREMRQ